MGKKIKLALWILTNNDIIDLVWSIYQAMKDGKITKEEMIKVNNKTHKMINGIIKDKVKG